MSPFSPTYTFPQLNAHSNSPPNKVDGFSIQNRLDAAVHLSFFAAKTPVSNGMRQALASQKKSRDLASQPTTQRPLTCTGTDATSEKQDSGRDCNGLSAENEPQDAAPRSWEGSAELQEENFPPVPKTGRAGFFAEEGAKPFPLIRLCTLCGGE